MGKKNPLDPFALNIGRLCNEWQHLEGAVETIFARIAGMEQGRSAMLHSVDIRQLIAGINVGVAVTMSPDLRGWSEEVISAVDYIDNVLRNRRNRYVHDVMWDSAVYGPLRQQRAPKLKRHQSHAPPSAWRQVRIEDAKDLRATLKSVRETARWLWGLDEWREQRETHPNARPWPLERLRPPLLPQGPTGKPLPEGIEPLVL